MDDAAIETGFGIGDAVRRDEDRRLLLGHGCYTSDIRRRDQLSLAFVRSPHAHATIGTIDTSVATSLPGVMVAIQSADLPDLAGLPSGAVTPGMPIAPTSVLARHSVHCVGQIVAAVVADSPTRARDAADAVRVHYELRPAIVDLERAIADDATLAFPELGTNVAFRQTHSAGDPDAIFASSAQVVRCRIASNRIAAVPLEPRCAVAEWDSTRGEMTLWAGVQAPFRARSLLAAVLELPEHAVRVVALDVGGGFGVKGSLYAEEVLVAVLARRLGRPVAWTGTRGEDMVTTVHAREQVQFVEGAFDADGRLRAVRLQVLCNLGAGARGAGIPSRTAQCITGCYAIEAVATEIVGVYTNSTPTGAYRGAGRPEAALAIERIMDEGAVALGLDPAEVRRRNFVAPEAFPYRSPAGIVLDSGSYERGMDECLRLFDYAGARISQGARRAHGEIVGIGMATYLELTGSGWESGALRVLPSGHIEAMTGSTDQGQGHATAWSQIISASLGVPREWVTVRHGDTSMLANGVGSFGSRSTVVGGSALALAATDIRDKMVQLAAAHFEVASTDVDWLQGVARIKGAPTRSVGFRELARLAYSGKLHRNSHGHPIEPGLEATRYFQPEGDAFSSGAYAAQVRIEPESGVITVERFVAVDDCGNVINPLLVDGQVFGGLAQGIGQAMWETIAFDAEGQPITGSLMDYVMPRASMMPPIVLGRHVTPSPRNPLGVKGVGEAGPIGAPPALLNAVLDALRPWGVIMIDMPLTPERVWRALHSAPRS